MLLHHPNWRFSPEKLQATFSRTFATSTAQLFEYFSRRDRMMGWILGPEDSGYSEIASTLPPEQIRFTMWIGTNRELEIHIKMNFDDASETSARLQVVLTFTQRTQMETFCVPTRIEGIDAYFDTLTNLHSELESEF